MPRAHILVISDDASFAQSLSARWKMEPRSPVLTQTSSDVGAKAVMSGFGLAIVGPVNEGMLEPLMGAIEETTTVLCVCASSQEARARTLALPATICVPQQDGWLDTLMLLSREIMKRVEADAHALQAERIAASRMRESVLGRSMMEMSHVITDALTSLLGNAELLLLAPEPFSPQSREQIRTIRTMALRLSEVMHHFSSLGTEFDRSEKESQSETYRAVSLR